MTGINTIYFPPFFTFFLIISSFPNPLSRFFLASSSSFFLASSPISSSISLFIFVLNSLYFSIFSSFFDSSSISSIFSFNLSNFPEVIKSYLQYTNFGFTTYPILIAFSSVIFDAICFLFFISSSVYPNFLAFSSDMSLPSTSLTGVAVIPKTLTFSF